MISATVEGIPCRIGVLGSNKYFTGVPRDSGSGRIVAFYDVFVLSKNEPGRFCAVRDPEIFSSKYLLKDF